MSELDKKLLASEVGEEIAAAVNFCEGFSTEALSKKSLRELLEDEKEWAIAKLKKGIDRDENWYDGYIAAINTILAKLKGE